MSTNEAVAKAEPDKSGQGKAARRWLQRQLAVWSRWLHIYLSLISFGAILFFSVTGLTLNHPDWFFSESTSTVEGKVPREWLHLQQSPPPNWDESDYGHQVDRLAVVESLRGEHGLSGRMSEFLSFQDECEVTFEGPGYAATARIRRDDGSYSLSIVSLVAITGLILVFFLKLHRKLRLTLAVAGILLILWMFRIAIN